MRIIGRLQADIPRQNRETVANLAEVPVLNRRLNLAHVVGLWPYKKRPQGLQAAAGVLLQQLAGCALFVKSQNTPR